MGGLFAFAVLPDILGNGEYAIYESSWHQLRAYPTFGDLGDIAQRTLLLLTLVGVCLMIAGYRFFAAAYKTKEETPGWMRWLLSFWK